MRSLLVVAVLLSGCTKADALAGIRMGLDLGDVVCKLISAAHPGEDWLEYTCGAVSGMAGLEAMPAPTAYRVKVHKADVKAFEARYVR